MSKKHLTASLSEQRTQFFPISFGFIDSGGFQKISGDALKIYMLLRRYVCRSKKHSLGKFYEQGWLASSVAYKEIGWRAELTRYKIRNGLDELVEAKYIRLLQKPNKAQKTPAVWSLGVLQPVDGTDTLIEYFFIDVADDEKLTMPDNTPDQKIPKAPSIEEAIAEIRGTGAKSEHTGSNFDPHRVKNSPSQGKNSIPWNRESNREGIDSSCSSSSVEELQSESGGDPSMNPFLTCQAQRVKLLTSRERREEIELANPGANSKSDLRKPTFLCPECRQKIQIPRDQIRNSEAQCPQCNIPLELYWINTKGVEAPIPDPPVRRREEISKHYVAWVEANKQHDIYQRYSFRPDCVDWAKDYPLEEWKEFCKTHVGQHPRNALPRLWQAEHEQRANDWRQARSPSAVMERFQSHG